MVKCESCKQLPVSAYDASCEACKETSRRYQRDRNRRLIGLGLCVKCSQPTKPGHSNCDSCMTKARERARERRNAGTCPRERQIRERREAGLCLCGRQPDDGAYCKRCKERNRLRHAKLDDEQRTRVRSMYLLRTYGIDLATFDAMLERQGGVCAICKEPETRVSKGNVTPLSVDHDHQTGRVRGLLCFACNSGLGRLGDTVQGLRAALEYLERSHT
jgi:hypothetical protein